ncbi:hypothetical protein BN940_09436 [Castellaniella defragrans 65Phen]|uniref:ATPase AAA-type core domain-containing protein n=2 Tax=Castellaniella defragrans TaxID=75697 RepID=W8X3R3_CASD6|nr:hypothetical protein BN940_09436 [Castellaniella defragrans 65Phen]
MARRPVSGSLEHQLARNDQYGHYRRISRPELPCVARCDAGKIIRPGRRAPDAFYSGHRQERCRQELLVRCVRLRGRLSGHGCGNVVQFMEREHKDRFRNILDRIASKIPGIARIDTEVTADKRVLLRFNDGAFDDPFFAQQMSDGTLKVFAYLLLLEDPDPPPFICIEEPENGLYHKLLEALAQEFRAHASGKKHAPQIFVTTHQPYFVDALAPEEVWILEKGADGYSTIRRVSELEMVRNLVAEGLPPGGLWYSDYLDAR